MLVDTTRRSCRTFSVLLKSRRRLPDEEQISEKTATSERQRCLAQMRRSTKLHADQTASMPKFFHELQVAQLMHSGSETCCGRHPALPATDLAAFLCTSATACRHCRISGLKEHTREAQCRRRYGHGASDKAVHLRHCRIREAQLLVRQRIQRRVVQHL